jgi:hypothetical protein
VRENDVAFEERTSPKRYDSQSKTNGEPPFSRYPFIAVEEQHRQRLSAAIAGINTERIRTSDTEALIGQFVDEVALEAPVLIEGAISVSVVAGDFMFGAFGESPHYVPGIRADYYVPYSGDREMFQVSTRRWGLAGCPT